MGIAERVKRPTVNSPRNGLNTRLWSPQNITPIVTFICKRELLNKNENSQTGTQKKKTLLMRSNVSLDDGERECDTIEKRQELKWRSSSGSTWSEPLHSYFPPNSCHHSQKLWSQENRLTQLVGDRKKNSVSALLSSELKPQENNKSEKWIHSESKFLSL